MDIKLINLNSDTIKSIYSIMLKLETHDRKIIRATKSIENLLELLICAKSSKHSEVIEAYVKFSNLLTDDQLGFFRSLGHNIIPPQAPSTEKDELRYRGSSTARPESVESTQGKRRMVYRGRETWV